MILREDGRYWPVGDVHGFLAIQHELVNIQHIIPFVKKFDVCVQAGGNVGSWAIEFSKFFKHVYSFEPDSDNFDCFEKNCQGIKNISALNCALGESVGSVGLSRIAGNCGAHHIEGSGPIPMVCIDDLDLPGCDLIQFDIEGYELKALKGAEETISKYSPVIVVEDKGLSNKYGTEKGSITEYLRGMKYSIAKNINKDIIFTREV